ncbi:M20 family metallo-hydrolase [bacterium]|nr:M20 family metallo-hydrolase [bacterium]
MELKQTLDKIESYRDAMIQMQKDIIPIEAITPVDGGSGELKKSKFLEKALKEFCDEVKIYNAPHKEAEGGVRPNVVGIIKGKDTSKTLWIMSHMDVVSAGDLSEWKTGPFEAVVEDGKIFGRGSEDNHQGLVASFYAAKAIKDLSIVPNYNIGLLFVADEECGSGFGIKYLLAEHKDIFKKEDQFVVTDAGTEDGSFVEIAEKGICRFKTTAEGKATHAAFATEGINANRMMTHFAMEIDKLHEKYDEKNDFFDIPYTTFEPTQRLANGVSFNTVPGKETQSFDLRVIPSYNLDSIYADVERIAKDIADKFKGKIILDKLVYDQPAPVTPKDTPSVVALSKAIKDIYQVEPKASGSGGGTVARFLRHAGFKVVVWSKIDQTLHKANEYCLIENMVGDSKVLGQVVLTI